jgi:uncharacterized membrane protein (DUF373 family)
VFTALGDDNSLRGRSHVFEAARATGGIGLIGVPRGLGDGATVSLKIVKFYDQFEKFIVVVLLVLLMLVILFATLQFASAVFHGLAEYVWHNLFRRNLEEVTSQIDVIHDVFAQFLLILIGIELMKTVMMYLDEHVIHVEVVLTVAIIAIARHAIDINYRETSPLGVLSTGGLVLALTLGYYFFKKAGSLS